MPPLFSLCARHRRLILSNIKFILSAVKFLLLCIDKLQLLPHNSISSYHQMSERQ